MTTIRLVIFTLLIPGTVAVYIPHWLVLQYPDSFDAGVWKYAGLGFILTGFGLYIASAFAFLFEGNGTPAIWFTRPLKSLIGEEPAGLVRTKLYRFTRNPMYAGVVLFVFGEALWTRTSVLLMYAALLWFCFHLVIVFIEEPHLREKNGASYEEYCRTVPRWFGFRPKMK